MPTTLPRFTRAIPTQQDLNKVIDAIESSLRVTGQPPIQVTTGDFGLTIGLANACFLAIVTESMQDDAGIPVHSLAEVLPYTGGTFQEVPDGRSVVRLAYEINNFQVPVNTIVFASPGADTEWIFVAPRNEDCWIYVFSDTPDVGDYYSCEVQSFFVDTKSLVRTRVNALAYPVNGTLNPAQKYIAVPSGIDPDTGRAVYAAFAPLDATISWPGIVSVGTQSFNGNKTFLGNTTFSGTPIYLTHPLATDPPSYIHWAGEVDINACETSIPLSGHNTSTNLAVGSGRSLLSYHDDTATTYQTASYCVVNTSGATKVGIWNSSLNGLEVSGGLITGGSVNSVAASAITGVLSPSQGGSGLSSFFGSGAPSSGIGDVGSIYFDVSSNTLYYKT